MHHYVSKYIELSQQDVPEISETFWRALRAHQKMEFQISILWLSAGQQPANGRPTAGLRKYTKEDFGALESHHMLYTTYVLIVDVKVDRF